MNRVRYPLVPQRVAENAILLFLPLNFTFCRKKSTAKFIRVKTSSGKVVVTSFLYPTVHRWIAGDPIYLNFALSDPPPPQNADFDRFRLIVPQPWELARKVQLSLIGSRQRAFHRAIDEPCALPLSHPKSGSKREFLHLALSFTWSLQVTVNISSGVCGFNIANHSLLMTNRPWNGRGHVTWPILNF